jgi:hypothetical protein
MQNYVITHHVRALFTGAHSDGTIEVGASDAVKLWPGARAVIGSNTQPAVEVLILEDLGSGIFRVRLDDTSAPAATGPRAVPVPGAGSNFGAYIVADAAFIDQPSGQLIFNYTHEGVVPRTPSALVGT